MEPEVLLPVYKSPPLVTVLPFVKIVSNHYGIHSEKNPPDVKK
jgi:hypothetical protein